MRISDWSSDVCSSDLNERYLDTGAGKHLGEFDTHIAATEDDHRFGQLGQVERGGAVEWTDIRKARDGRHRRTRASRDHDPFSCEALSARFNTVFDEARRALLLGDVVVERKQVGIFRLTKVRENGKGS